MESKNNDNSVSIYKLNKENLSTLLWEWPIFLIILVSVLIGVFSYHYNNTYFDELFARSGAIIVLLAAINEYLLRNLRDRQLGYYDPDFLKKTSEFTRKLFRPKVYLGQQVAGVLSHIQVVVGTIIWGFGDLLF